MPAEYEAYIEAFEELVGTTGPAETWSGGEAGGVYEWIDIYETTGVPADLDREGSIDAFSEFLIAFYPQDKSPDDWWYDRQEWYDTYDVDERSIDWEAYAEAAGSPKGEQ